jgi:hypothetical protein
VVGRADGWIVRAMRGGIWWRRARPHSQPFHGGGATRERRQGKRGKDRKKKGVRWRPDEGVPLGSDPSLRVMWPGGWLSVGGPRIG